MYFRLRYEHARMQVSIMSGTGGGAAINTQMSFVGKRGYLYKLPQRGFVKKWSKRWFVLRSTSHEGVVRIEYFDTEECAISDQSKRTIPLRDSSRVEQTTGNKIHPYIFQFNSQIGHHVLAADSQPELDEWVDAIKEAIREDRMHMRRKKTQSMVVKRSGEEYPTDSVGKGYASKLDSGVYRVTLEQNDIAENMNLHGAYNLEISPTQLSLNNSVTGSTIAKWHYKHLKSYGKKSGKFHFEVGKTSSTGPGQFMCVTTCSKEIFGIVNHNIKRLRADIEDTKIRKQQSEPALRHSQPVHKPSQTKSSLQGTRSRQSASDIVDEGVRGNYLTSKELEEGVLLSEPDHLYSVVQKKKPVAQAQKLSEEDLENHYTVAGDDPCLQNDPSNLYSRVINPRNINSSEVKERKGPPLKPQPYASSFKKQSAVRAPTKISNPYVTPFDTQGGEAAATTSNRFSYDSTRDSRDSALVNIDVSIFDSLGEESTMSSGIHNPLGDTCTDTFDFGQLTDNFFQQLDKFDHPKSAAISRNDPWQVAEEGGSHPTAASNGNRLTQQEIDQIWDDIQTTTNF